MVRSSISWSARPFRTAGLFLILYTARLMTSAQDCNICGEGNEIGAPQGVVTITYEGQVQTNNCQTWQSIVSNPVVISDDFCRNEMPMYTIEPCRCFTADGELVSDLSTPAPSLPPMTAGTGGSGAANVPSMTQGGNTTVGTGGSGAENVPSMTPGGNTTTSPMPSLMNPDTSLQPDGGTLGPSVTSAPFGAQNNRCVEGNGTTRGLMEGCNEDPSSTTSGVIRQKNYGWVVMLLGSAGSVILVPLLLAYC